MVRGCAVELSVGELSICTAGRDCKICHGDNCNSRSTYQSCYICDSATNPYCFMSQTSIPNAEKKTCMDYSDQCVTFTNAGVTYRGCSKELTIPSICKSCVYCSGQDCNVGVATVPSELSCHTCESTPGMNCEEDKSEAVATPCNYNLVVGRVDQCYTYQSGSQFSRGCLHNSPFEVQLGCSLNNGECKLCGSNGCNSELIETHGYCYSCDGTDDPNCASLTNQTPKYCAKGEKQGCFRSQISKSEFWCMCLVKFSKLLFFPFRRCGCPWMCL